MNFTQDEKYIIINSIISKQRNVFLEIYEEKERTRKLQEKNPDKKFYTFMEDALEGKYKQMTKILKKLGHKTADDFFTEDDQMDMESRQEEQDLAYYGDPANYLGYDA